MAYQGLIDKYRAYLPVDDSTPVISLSEGNTPLIKLNNIMKQLNLDVDIYVKYEGLNPTGSFKDRGMTMAVSKAAEKGAKAIICASTGNTSAAAAAYAARANMKAFVLIPTGKIALGKLAQALVFGAQVIQIEGNFDDGMDLVKAVAKDLPIEIVNSINPFRLQGQKTAAFEVIEQLKQAPDYHALPVGNAGNITAYWMGYSQYFEKGLADKKPIMLGYQASGAAPFIQGEMVENPETVATAIRIGKPQSWQQAWQAQKQSNGWFGAFSDAVILATQKQLAEQEGIFCEPASAVSLAGVLHDIKAGRIKKHSVIVCTLTGNGLKDTDTAVRGCQNNIINIKPTLSQVHDTIAKQMI